MATNDAPTPNGGQEQTGQLQLGIADDHVVVRLPNGETIGFDVRSARAVAVGLLNTAQQLDDQLAQRRIQIASPFDVRVADLDRMRQGPNGGR